MSCIDLRLKVVSLRLSFPILLNRQWSLNMCRFLEILPVLHVSDAGCIWYALLETCLVSRTILPASCALTCKWLQVKSGLFPWSEMCHPVHNESSPSPDVWICPQQSVMLLDQVHPCQEELCQCALTYCPPASVWPMFDVLIRSKCQEWWDKSCHLQHSQWIWSSSQSSCPLLSDLELIRHCPPHL